MIHCSPFCIDTHYFILISELENNRVFFREPFSMEQLYCVNLSICGQEVAATQWSGLALHVYVSCSRSCCFPLISK